MKQLPLLLTLALSAGFLGSCRTIPKAKLPQSPSTDAVLKTIDSTFTSQLQQTYSTDSAVRMRRTACKFSSMGDSVLGRYFAAVLKRDYSAAQGALYEFHAQLRCVSQAEFRSINAAFAQAALSRSTAESRSVHFEVTQALAPLAYLIFERSGPSLNRSYYQWFRRNRVSLVIAAMEPQPLLGKLRLVAPWGDYLVALTPQESSKVLATFGRNASVFGDCTTEELVAVPGELRMFCPKHCRVIDWIMERLDPALHSTLADEFPEFNLCADLRDLRDKSSSVKDELLKCMAAYADTSSGDPIACLAERFADRSILDKFGLPGEMEYELRTLRNCWLSQPASDDATTDDDEPAALSPETEALLSKILNETDHAIEDALATLPEGHRAPAFGSREEELEAGADFVFQQLESSTEYTAATPRDTQEREAATQSVQRLIEALFDALDLLWKYKESQGRMCAAESADCVDTCQQRNELLDATSECFEPKRSDDFDPGQPPGTLVLPDPNKPPQPSEGLRQLVDCMQKAYQDTRSVGAQGCGATDCGADQVPCGAFPRCYCCSSDGSPRGFRHPCENVLDCGDPLVLGVGALPEGGGACEVACSCGVLPMDSCEGPDGSPESVLRIRVALPRQ